jgi:hypothetical protein
MTVGTMRRNTSPTWLASPAPTLFLALFAAQAGVLSLTPILPELARDLGVSTATAGGLRVLSGVAGGVTALVLVRVWRRLGLRDLIRLGALLIGLGSLSAPQRPASRCSLPPRWQSARAWRQPSPVVSPPRLSGAGPRTALGCCPGHWLVSPPRGSSACRYTEGDAA